MMAESYQPRSLSYAGFNFGTGVPRVSSELSAIWKELRQA